MDLPCGEEGGNVEWEENLQVREGGGQWGVDHRWMRCIPGKPWPLRQVPPSPPPNPQGLRASLDKARTTLLDILESKTRNQSTW